MIKSGKKLKELSIILKKRNNQLTAEAIKSLRNNEPFKGAIGLLVTHFNENEDRSVRKIIEEFFNDLKDKSLRPEVMAEIRKPLNSATISMLISSCWQSGMDYSDYLEDIADVYLRGDYVTAIECMTVIEESVGNCTTEKKNGIIKTIEESPLSGLNEKSALTLELISILER
jgi:hypothetical protein